MEGSLLCRILHCRGEEWVECWLAGSRLRVIIMFIGLCVCVCVCLGRYSTDSVYRRTSTVDRRRKREKVRLGMMKMVVLEC